MRTTYQDGTVRLVARFVNGNGDLIDPDSGQPIYVSIFDPDHPPFDPDVVDGDAIVLNAVPTKEETGVYYYEYTLDPDAATGAWYDRWTCTIDGVAHETNFSFTVVEKTSPESPSLDENMIVRVVIDSSVANTNGETLAEDYEFFFSSVLNPMYASSDLLGLELGAYIPNIPPFTLDLNIHWASIQADAQTFRRIVRTHPITDAPVLGSLVTNNDYFNLVRTEFVLCKSSSTLLTNAIATIARSKRLADLEVVYDSGAKDHLKDLSARCSELRRLLNAGGRLSEGASLPLVTAVKGSKDLDRPTFGRDWLNLANMRGGANTKSVTGTRRAKRHWAIDPTLFKPWW
jgi:hypothetical protein